MSNFFEGLVKKALPDSWEYKLGITPEPKAMKFEVGEGLSTEQKTQAQEKIGQLQEQAPEPQENFFASIIRDIPRGVAGLTLKVAGKEGETFEPGLHAKTPLAADFEKFVFGTETIKRPETGFEFAMAGLMALPVLPGKAKITKEVSKRLIEKYGATTAKNIVKKGGKELAEQALKEGGEAVVKKSGVTLLAKEVGTKAVQTTAKGKEKILSTLKEIQPELEAIKGKPLTYAEVKEAAKTSELLRATPTTREATLRFEAQLQATKSKLGVLAGESKLTEDFVNTLKQISAQGTDLGRKLNSLKIDAMPELAQTKSQIVKKLIELGYKTDDIIKAAQGMDLNNADEVAKFYRKFVKPSLGEIVDEYRYINMLSSPRTHIVNSFTNFIQTTILAPATKLATGAIDLISNGLRGNQRQAYVREVPVYYRGAMNNFGKAITETYKVMKGQSGVYRPDISRIPTKVKALAPFQIIPKILEASDVFFRTLIRGGETEALAYRALRQGKKPTAALIAQIEKEAADKAQYYVFRQALDPNNKTGQGAVLAGVDKMSSGIQQARKFKPISWFIPFLITPMNILKQGIEFSPLGLTTLAGSTQKSVQLAKTMVGSTVFAGAAYIASTGNSTWATPTDEKERKLFYASGKQPYSMKVGNYWISYSRIGPIAYPMAMAAAFQHYTKENPEANTQGNLEKTKNILTGISGFFSDQSYVKGMGDMLNLITGEEGAASRTVASFSSQLIPLSSLQRWVNSMLDEVYRKPSKDFSVEGFIDNLKQNIVGLSQSIPPYPAPFGQDSKRDFPILNALSPMGVTIEKQGMANLYELLMDKRTLSAEMRKLKEDLRKQLGF